jgi:hypothetical protein
LRIGEIRGVDFVEMRNVKVQSVSESSLKFVKNVGVNAFGEILENGKNTFGEANDFYDIPNSDMRNNLNPLNNPGEGQGGSSGSNPNSRNGPSGAGRSGVNEVRNAANVGGKKRWFRRMF